LARPAFPATPSHVTGSGHRSAFPSFYLHKGRASRLPGGRLAMDEWTRGYSREDLDEAQARHGVHFPPDFLALLIARRPVQAYDWRHDDVAIRKALEWPLEGLLFDLEHSNLWL